MLLVTRLLPLPEALANSACPLFWLWRCFLHCRVSMSASSPALQFVLASYDINGTWLGLHNWTTQLQVCGGSTHEAALWTRYVCHIQLGQGTSGRCVLIHHSLMFDEQAGIYGNSDCTSSILAADVSLSSGKDVGQAGVGFALVQA